MLRRSTERFPLCWSSLPFEVAENILLLASCFNEEVDGAMSRQSQFLSPGYYMKQPSSLRRDYEAAERNRDASNRIVRDTITLVSKAWSNITRPRRFRIQKIETIRKLDLLLQHVSKEKAGVLSLPFTNLVHELDLSWEPMLMFEIESTEGLLQLKRRDKTEAAEVIILLTKLSEMKARHARYSHELETTTSAFANLTSVRYQAAYGSEFFDTFSFAITQPLSITRLIVTRCYPNDVLSALGSLEHLKQLEIHDPLPQDFFTSRYAQDTSAPKVQELGLSGISYSEVELQSFLTYFPFVEHLYIAGHYEDFAPERSFPSSLDSLSQTLTSLSLRFYIKLLPDGFPLATLRSILEKPLPKLVLLDVQCKRLPFEEIVLAFQQTARLPLLRYLTFDSLLEETDREMFAPLLEVEACPRLELIRVGLGAGRRPVQERWVDYKRSSRDL